MSGASPVPTKSRPVAAFDFDGTLLAGDTLMILHRLLRSPWGQLIDGLQLLPDLLLWKSGQRSTDWFKQMFLRLILDQRMCNRSAKQNEMLYGLTLANALWDRLRPEALARLEWHRQQGHRLIIISASPRLLVQPIADRLSVELIATETNKPCHTETIRLISANCKGQQKVERLKDCLQQTLEHLELHAYGDSRGDRELLRCATHPHWRSFKSTPCPYPRDLAFGRLLIVSVIALMAFAAVSLFGMDPSILSHLQSGFMQLSLWLPGIISLLFFSYVCRYWRFRLLVKAEGVGCAGWPEAWIWFQGFALTATPGKIGELTRIHQLHRHLGYPREPLLHAFLAERCCDVAAVSVWLALLVPEQLQQRFANFDQLPIVWASLGLLVLLALGALALRKRLIKHLPKGRLAKACLPATCVSLGLWGSEAMILWILVQALSPSAAITPWQAISIYLLSGTAGMASPTPGGLGVNEGATALLLHQCGVDFMSALSIALFRRLCTVWLITGLAVLSILVGCQKGMSLN